VTHKSIDPHHMPKPATIAAVKRTNDEQRLPAVEQEAQRQRTGQAHPAKA
jgi:hypothetical protein